MNLQSPIAELKGFGFKSAEKFIKLGLYKIEDSFYTTLFATRILKVGLFLNLWTGRKLLLQVR